VLRPQADPTAAKVIAEGIAVETLQAVLAGTEVDDAASASALRALGERHLQRLTLQDHMRAALRDRVDVPLLELPYLATRSFAENEVSQLADVISAAVTGDPTADAADPAPVTPR
jgi:hypothetical protein